MKLSGIITAGALAIGSAFADGNASSVQAQAPEAAKPSLYDSCMDSLAAVKAKIPANGLQARLTLIEAESSALDLKNAIELKETAERTSALAEVCFVYAKIIAVEADNQILRNRITENWEKRAATARSIEAIQEQINQVRSGKVNDLEAEKMNMKDQKARLEAEMQQNQEKFLAEAQAQEAALKAAGEREAELQRQQADLQKQLEAEKAALAEERAKAEARQADAMNRLNELQSKLIQVSKDARGIILSMSDILFDVDKATLKQDLKTSLAKVAGILSVYQQFNVSIEGNTDNTGSEEHNMKLSQQRADNVMKFLVEQGIEAGRLTAKGLGMTMPVADNSTKEGRQKNRRVDLVIQDKVLQQPSETAPTAAPETAPASAPAPAAPSTEVK